MSVRRSKSIRKNFVPIVTCLAFTAQAVSVSAAPKEGDHSSLRNNDAALQRGNSKRNKKKHSSIFGWFSFMSKKTFSRIKRVLFTAAAFALGYKALSMANDTYTKYENRESIFSPEDFSKDVSPDVVALFTKPRSKFSYLKNNKKGAALVAEFIDKFRKDYISSGGDMSLKRFCGGIDYGEYGDDYAKALNSLPIGYLADSGIFPLGSSNEEDKARFTEFFDAVVSNNRYSILQKKLGDRLVKAGKTKEDYLDDVAQVFEGSTLQLKKAGAAAAGAFTNGIVQVLKDKHGGAAMMLSMVSSVVQEILRDNIQQQEKQENGNRQ